LTLFVVVVFVLVAVVVVVADKWHGGLETVSCNNVTKTKPSFSIRLVVHFSLPPIPAEANPAMALYLVNYDLRNHATFGQYETLIAELEKMGARRVLLSEWVLRSNYDSEGILQTPNALHS
jgi:hypothetical protein